MAKHLPPPAGEPESAAKEIIDAIESYRDSARDPLVKTRGLRHILQAAELSWDASVDEAKSGATYAQLTEATGVPLGTLQGRIRLHRAQQSKPSRA